MGGDPTRRGTSNADDRGSSYARRQRKRNLLERDGTGPDGVALCATCPTLVDFETMTVDRIVPGCEGGRYGPPSDTSNCRIQCERCAPRQGGHLAAQRRAERRQAA